MCVLIFFFSQCIEMIKSVDTELRKSENEVMADLEPDVRHSFQAAEEQRLNFGLVQVVYEWARNKVIYQYI